MKINRLDAHDRLISLKKNDFSISECCQDLINKRPFGHHAFYIFAHTRTDDDGVTKRLIWQPRLTKPKAQTNSMLFKAYPGSDNLKVIWVLPVRELWTQFKLGNVTESPIVIKSIDMFENHRSQLEMKEDDDLNDDKIDEIYRSIARGIKATKIMTTLNSSVESSSS